MRTSPTAATGPHNETGGGEFLAVSGLQKSYGSGIVTPVLRGTGLELERQRIGVILGPSGSGKSTLMNIIGGIDRADAGTVEVDGERISDLTDDELLEYRRAQCRLHLPVLQPGAEPHRGREHRGGVQHQREPAEDRRGALRRRTRRQEEPIPPGAVGGEQQRVAIARAIVKSPRLLLCDEPTGALDLETSRGVLALLQRVNAEFGTTILMITHNAAIADMAHSVYRMRDGRVEETTHHDQPVPAERIQW